MYLSQESREALTRKNPHKTATADRAIFEYIRATYPGILDEIENHGNGQTTKSDTIDAGTYARNITITSSHNEPKIYAHIEDGDGLTLYLVSILGNDPTAYAKAAKAAGAIMETFNLYAFYNDL